VKSSDAESFPVAPPKSPLLLLTGDVVEFRFNV
jgi:hypothetical protein